MTWEALLSFYADAFLDDIVKEGDVVEETELTEFLTDMKRIIDGSEVSDGTREKRPSSIWGLLEKGTYLYSNVINGFFESGQGASIIEQAQGVLEADVILINETYVPYGTIGITKASKNQETDIKTALEAVKKDNAYLFQDVSIPRVVAPTPGPGGDKTDDTRTQANNALRSILGRE